MNRAVSLVTFVFFGYFLSGTYVNGQSQETIKDPKFTRSIEAAGQYIDSLRSIWKVPGLSITVSVDNKIAWSEGFGYANEEDKILADVNTKFRIGSISKTLTAIALGKLIEEGKLSLDDNARKYVPEFPEKKYPFTVRHLATHQSGIPHYGLSDFLANRGHYSSVTQSLEVFDRRKLKFKPGTDFLYSSYGYVLLSAVIEGAAGMLYLKYMKEEVLEPLGAENTVPDDVTQSIPNRSVFYKEKNGRVAKEIDLSYKWASGGFLSTSYDLVKLADGMNRLFDVRTIELLTTPVPLENGEMNPQNYGFGWRYYENEKSGLKAIHHGGVSVGGRAFLAKFLNENVTVAILTNAKADYNLQEVFNVMNYFKNN